MADPYYIDSQGELAWRMRGILADWLIQIHMRFRFLPETIFLAVNIVDRFLSKRVVALAKLQLVGITASLIAAKYEEVVHPSPKQFCAAAEGDYDTNDIVKAEAYILKVLDWDISYPGPLLFLRQISLGADAMQLGVSWSDNPQLSDSNTGFADSNSGEILRGDLYR